MLLAIDVGNTNSVIGVFEGKKLLEHWRLKTDARRTHDEYGILLRQLFAWGGLETSGISAIAVKRCNRHSLRPSRALPSCRT